MEKLSSAQLTTPRFDLLTKEILPYKSKEFYFSNFYANRRNLIKHFKQITKLEAYTITKSILENRIKFKSIEYAPSQVELRSLIAPSVILLKSLKINYEDIYNDLSLKPKYRYENIKLKKVNMPTEIICDTREQNPLKFDGIICKKHGLKFGDYATTQELYNTISIERKSLSDFCGTLSKGFERFKKEILRAQNEKCNLLMVVEAKFNDINSINFLPQTKWIKAKPEFLFSRLRELIQEYPNFQVVFVDDRKRASEIILFSLAYGKRLFDYDVQFLFDCGMI